MTASVMVLMNVMPVPLFVAAPERP
jgi:hypothetical protein